MGNRAGHDIPVPSWLAEAADEVQLLDKHRVRPIFDVHPLDRANVAKARAHMLQRPGELIACAFRRRVGGELRRIEDTLVDLSGHDGLGVVVVREDIGPAQGLDQWTELESTFEFESVASTLEYFILTGSNSEPKVRSGKSTVARLRRWSGTPAWSISTSDTTARCWKSFCM